MTHQKTRVVMATATPGGGFPAYGWPYAEVLNATDPTLAIEPINTKGSNENVVSLEEGKVDLGLVTGEVTYEAISGLGRPKANNLRIINATYSQAGMFMVKADSPYKSISVENTLAAAPTRDLVHPGVLKYMKEFGLLQ